MEAQRKSIVLLENQGILPVAAQGKTLYVNNANADVAKQYGFDVIDGNTGATAEGADLALIRVKITNSVAQAMQEDGTPYTYADGSTVTTMFGGPVPSEINMMSLSEMATATTWVMTPSLETIQQVMDTVGAENTIISINFRQPYVIDEASGVRDAGAILATFGVSDNALLDVVTGAFNPCGKLPFALASNVQAIIDQDPDLPGYAANDTLYPFGHGLSY